jgi:hypothetical protein
MDEKEALKERAKLEPERNYILFLTNALGNFLVPTGSAVLGRLVEEQPAIELQALTLRRRSAIWALANLGSNLRKFDQLPTLEQNLVLDQMKKLDETTQGEPRKWDQSALECLEKRKAGQYTTMGVDRSLIKATEAEDPVVRYSAGYALGFWKGDAEQNRRIEDALVRLTHDNGRGMDRLEEFQGPDPGETPEVLSRPGLIVQINATLSLLRLGSSKARPSLVKEMLNEKQLGEDIQVQNKAGKREPNQGKVVMIVEMTLKALTEYYRQKPADLLEGVPARIKELTVSSNPTILVAAREANRALETAEH